MAERTGGSGNTAIVAIVLLVLLAAAVFFFNPMGWGQKDDGADIELNVEKPSGGSDVAP